jgi:hypothetical protein
MLTKKMFGFALTLMLALTLAACGDDLDDDDHTDEDPIAAVNEEGCEHLAEGPFIATAATTDATNAPSVASDHNAYRISLPEVEGSIARLGYVSFDSDEATDYVLFLDKNIGLTVLDADGEEVEIEETELSVPQCTIVKARHTVELGVGVYNFVFSDLAIAEVLLVIEEAEHED